MKSELFTSWWGRGDLGGWGAKGRTGGGRSGGAGGVNTVGGGTLLLLAGGPVEVRLVWGVVADIGAAAEEHLMTWGVEVLLATRGVRSCGTREARW